MVTKVSAFDEPKEIYCLSTDTKPTDVPNGSILIEMDTSTIYTFDEAGSTWNEWGGENG